MLNVVGLTLEKAHAFSCACHLPDIRLFCIVPHSDTYFRSGVFIFLVFSLEKLDTK